MNINNIKIKRVYDPIEETDGFRILVDRLWPRGLTKEAAGLNLWLKAVSPSNDLRKWYHQNPDNWPEFEKRYFAELAANTDAVNELLTYIKQGSVCFLHASKELEHNNATALRDYLHRYSTS